MGPQEPDEAFRSHWIEYPMTALFPGEDRSRPDLTIEVRCGERPMTVRSVEGRVHVEPGPAAAPDLVLTGPPDAVLGLFTHRLTVDDAKARGLAVTATPAHSDGCARTPPSVQPPHAESLRIRVG
jgi:hypothetical protein